MAKDTSLLRCREMELGCSVRPEKALTNSGFRLSFDVNTFGFLPDHYQVRSISKVLEKIIVSRCNHLMTVKAIDDLQKELF